MKFIVKYPILGLLVLTLNVACDRDSTTPGSDMGPSTATSTATSTDFGSTGSKLPEVASMSDEEIAKLIGFVEVVDAAPGEPWGEYEALTSREYCRTNDSLKHRPDRAALGYLHINYEGKLTARYCGNRGCESLEVQRVADQIVVETPHNGVMWQYGDRFEIGRNASGQWIATYLATRTVWSGDVVHTCRWTLPVRLEVAAQAPKATLFASKHAFDEVMLTFDQPVTCDSLAVTLTGTTQPSPGYRVTSGCDPGTQPLFPSSTMSVILQPTQHWTAQAYQISLAPTKGITGLLSAQQTFRFEIPRPMQSSQDFDFEQVRLDNWFHGTGSMGCTSVTGPFQAEDKTSFNPSSGQRMFECASRELGTNTFVTAVRIPATAKTMSFSVASLMSHLDHRYFLNTSFIQAGNGARVSLIGDAVDSLLTEKTRTRSGWNRVQVELPPHHGLLELNLGINGCAGGEGIPPGLCSLKRVLFDDFRFE